MPEFAVESVGDVWGEATALMERNEAETGPMEGEEFAPDKDNYLILEKTDMLRLFTVRKDGRLIGYAMFIVTPHSHYTKMMWAIQDVIYVDEAYRFGRLTMRFIDYQDALLREGGVDVVLRQVSVKVDYSKMLERMGYTEKERGFTRRL